MCRYWMRLWLVVILSGIFGCVTPSHKALVELPACDVTLAEQALVTAPEKISIFPVKVDIGELDAGGSTELVPEWSAEGTKVVEHCVNAQVKSYPGLQVVPLPELSREDKQVLDQYRALYEMAILNYEYIKAIPAWDHLVGRVTTVGPGMSGLREQLGTDAILFVSGYDFHSTAGRKAAFVLYAALAGAPLPMGFCKLRTGLVDVESGDILWSFSNESPMHSLKNEQHVQQMLNASFASFPKVRNQEGEHAEPR